MTSTTADRPARHDPVPSAAVWDLGVRVFHWSLVATVATALFTGFLAPRWWLDIHVIAGTIVAMLLVFRLVWGFLGSTYARFDSFLVSPFTALKHAIALLRGKAAHHTGHNPVGTMMIVTLLLVLFTLTLTGTISLGGTLKDGPLAPTTSYAAGTAAGGIHALLAWILLALIAGHVTGVIIDSLRTRENLVRAMVTGRKRAHPDRVPQVPAKPIRATITLAGLAAVLVPGVLVPSFMPVPGVPTAPLDSVYMKECSACHSPHHPSLATAAVWSKILDRLADHFGDNATLEPAQVEHLRAYLTANSASAWDTKAAYVVGYPGTTSSLRITQSPGWKSIHRDIQDAAFTSKAVNGKLNCAACHADSNLGQFKPRAIAFPSERKLP
ncbi:MAG: cytochrome b/b6 domain-containing protein [Hyphomicrobiaceae bacterium]